MNNICIFGSYDSKYSRNAVMLRGMREAGAKIIDCHVEAKLSKFNSPEDASLLKIVLRVLRKFILIPKIIKSLPKISKADAILVMYPGQVELPLAFLVKLIFRKPLLFDAFDSVYEAYVINRKMIKKGSLVAKCIFYYEKIVYGMADLVIVHSNVDRERFHGRFNIPSSKLETLYLGADDKIYYPGRKRQSKFFEVVYFGLYLPVHGVETIVRAAKILKKEKNIRFTLVGKGQTFESCLEFVERNNLGNVRMIAEVGEDPKTMDMLQQADIFLGVFQSGARIEQVLPNKVFQGLALKKAVITAKTRAVEDVCEDNVHIVYCKRGSAGSLAEKILILKNKPLLRRKIAENGYKHFKDQFSPRAIGDRLINICSN